MKFLSITNNNYEIIKIRNDFYLYGLYYYQNDLNTSVKIQTVGGIVVND